VCASTTAMLLSNVSLGSWKPIVRSYMGTPISSACCSAACKATLAPFCVRVGNDAVAAVDGAMTFCLPRRALGMKAK
jgi:hypothetical protein